MDHGDETIVYEEEFTTSLRGPKLFTCKWLPKDQEPKALVFICHGYGMECSISMTGTGTRLARAGFAVHGIDYEGHGKSSGLQGYIPIFSNIVDDCSSHFSTICERPENKKKRRFLLGESMGGAVVLLLHRKMPTYWHGAVLVAPMCKIAEDMKPHPIVVNTMGKLANMFPKWRIVPVQDIINVAFKSPEYREEVRSNKYCYKGRPRLKTALELLMASTDIERTLGDVSIPFLVVHGGNDVVTDPGVSKLLYETAASGDKAFKLYPGMWHALTSAEPPENIDLVFTDIVAWLDERAVALPPETVDGEGAGAGEWRLKASHDEKKDEEINNQHQQLAVGDDAIEA